ncbi:MAG: 3-deoxy-7-phosphoheptulonate synthase, partial [Clostridium sp.]|nr:3-deoxy-7-phosphoheptulonate synthase [Clostridium sp.]
MGFTFVNELPTPDMIREQFPLASNLAEAKLQRDEEIKKVLTGESDKFIVLIGPCSADNEDSVVDYTSRLIKVQEKTRDRLIIIPRVYTNKPRTTGEGYMGMIHQPDPEKKPDMFEGILAIRHMHMRVMRETGFSTADEMLYPENMRYLSDLMSYVAVSARSVENQFHRLVASGCDVPVGMKNPTSGDLTVMLNSVVAAQLPHDFIFCGWEVQCPGNPLTHTILRGAVNKHGQSIPNYHYEDLRLLFDLYGKRNLENPACIVDTNHSNS